MKDHTVCSLFRQERGDALIIEYAIVLPICLLVFFFLFMFGFMLNQYALLDSAAERGILVAQKIFTDTNADKMMSFSGMTAASSAGFQAAAEPDYDSFRNEPYRFLNTSYKSKEINETVESTVSEIIRKNQLLGNSLLGETRVNCEIINGFLDKTVMVTVEQEFRPMRLLIMAVPSAKEKMTLKSTARLKIRSQTEFVRNTDFVCDLALRYGLDKYTQKIATFFDKIKKFFQG